MKLTLNIFLILFTVACGIKDNYGSRLVHSDTITYNDGYLVKFFSDDPESADSTHRYKNRFDSFFLTERVIINNSKESSNITFKRNNDSIIITLNNPQYDYIALVNTDTIIWGANYPSNILSISMQDSALLDAAYIQNWGIIALNDTVGSMGVQTNKLIKIISPWFMSSRTTKMN